MNTTEEIVSIDNNQSDKKNTFIINHCPFNEIIKKYISLLDSQLDSFDIIYKTMSANVMTCINHYNTILKNKKIKVTKNDDNKEIIYTVPLEHGREFERIKDELDRSIQAFILFPQHTVVAMVSLYDAYLSELIECAYITKPQLLNACEKTFSFSDIIQFGSIDTLKKNVIEKDVESIIRESHIKQLELLSNKFSVALTKDLPCYNNFIEITERRNLFVHTNGRVSSQYLKTCNERPVDHKDEDVKIGEVLSAEPMYIEHCYNTLFEIGVKLGQVIWRKLEKDLKNADESLIEIGYELIKQEKYSLACVILGFSCERYVKHFNKETEYVLCVNRALAYYLKGDNNTCKEIINSVDWSGADSKFRLAHKVLLEQYDDAIDIMKKIGKDDSMLYAYAEWPLFNNFRTTKQFKDLYKSIFGRDYQYSEIKHTKWEDVVQEAMGMIKESKKQKKKSTTANEEKK